MQPLTFSFIKNNWINTNGCFHNDLALDDTVADIDKILTIIDRIMTDGIKLSISEGKRYRRKVKNVNRTIGLPPAQYVANNTQTNTSGKSGLSYYDKQKKIVISLSNGDKVEGIIRISNHEVDLGKWAENNDTDFGISFVLYEDKSELIGNNIVPTGNRMLCIYEYLYNVKRSNQNYMDVLVALITNIKTQGVYAAGQMIKAVYPKEVTNKNVIDADGLSSKISEIIVSELDNNK